MHCPRCGQEQVSGNLKFCSRCGLPLTLVAEVVNNNGILPQLEELTKKRGFFTRANGLKIALIWFVVIEMLLVPLTAIAGGEEEVAVLAVIGFVGAVIIAILSAMFLKSSKQSKPAAANEVAYGRPAEISNVAAPGALPPGQTQTADEYVAPAAGWKTPDTEDLVRPGSVTEGTTRLLKKEEEGPRDG